MVGNSVPGNRTDVLVWVCAQSPGGKLLFISGTGSGREFTKDTPSAGFLPAPVVTILVLWVLMLILVVLSHQPWPEVARVPAKKPRSLKPKTGDDCARCRDFTALKPEVAGRCLPPPWRANPSRRGPKKHSNTEGLACVQPACGYLGITDATLHALIAYGGHGKDEWIQDLYCDACQPKFTVRRDTGLYRLTTPSAEVAEALTYLAEGVDVSVLERTMGKGEGTLRTWVTRAGLHAAKLHAHFFQRLTFHHIQLDELWANVREKRRGVWVWTSLEVTTKIVRVIRLGPRTLAVAQAVVHELRQRMQAGQPLPVFSTDGLRLYFYALTAHFGQWVTPPGDSKRVWHIAADFIYGQVKKVQRRRRLIKVELQMLWGEWAQLRTQLKAAGLSGWLNTAFIERLNLTLRQGVALLTRRTWALRPRSTCQDSRCMWNGGECTITLRVTMKACGSNWLRPDRGRANNSPVGIVRRPRRWSPELPRIGGRCWKSSAIPCAEG
jgi:IS1 family transposase